MDLLLDGMTGVPAFEAPAASPGFCQSWETALLAQASQLADCQETSQHGLNRVYQKV